MTDQEYDTETLKRELGRLELRVTKSEYTFDSHPWVWAKNRSEATEDEALLRLLDYARHDKSLTGAMLTEVAARCDSIAIKGMGPSIDISTETFSDELDGFQGDMVSGRTLHEAAFRLWEAACLQGGPA